jgi:hypothetical protein
VSTLTVAETGEIIRRIEPDLKQFAEHCTRLPQVLALSGRG